MAQVDIPEFRFKRTRTRTYDIPAENTPAIMDALAALLVPAGSFVPTALTSQPEGGAWLLCDGSAVSKSDFSRLYGILQGKVAETDSTFNLPDLRGRIMKGAGGALSVGGLTGADEVTLTVDQMPEHGHTLTDPGHTHAFTGAPHSHVLTDPGHSHAAAGININSAESAGAIPTDGARSVATDSATTGITLDEATAGGANASATTGISIGNAGSGNPVNIMPQVFGINWLVRT